MLRFSTVTILTFLTCAIIIMFLYFSQDSKHHYQRNCLGSGDFFRAFLNLITAKNM